MKDFFARGQISDEPGPAALLRTGRFQQRRRYLRKLNALRACGADDGTATRTPSAWMISPLLLCPRANPAPNRVLGVGHFKRAEVGHSCQAPKRQSSLMGTNPSCQALLPSVSVGGCTHAAEKWSAALTPCQATTGCGGVQRSLPTGAAA